MTDLHTAAKQDIPDLIAGALGVSRGTAYDMMREALVEQPAQQEPVGRLESDPDEGHVFVPRIEGDWSMLGEDLYTSPPAQRKPLTDEEILALSYDGDFCIVCDDDAAILIFARAIEAAHGITGD